MNSTLLRLTIRRHWLSVSLCALLPLIIGGVIGLVYPTYSQERQLARLFKLGTQFFGKGGQIDLFSPAGSFSLPFQHPTVLIIYAVITAIPAMTLPAGERGRRSLDLLLSTQLSRTTLVGTLSLFSSLVAILIGLSAYLGAWIGASMSEVTELIPWGTYAMVACNSTSLCAFWSGVAILVSVLARDRASATLYYGVLVAGALSIDIAARLMKSGDWLAWYTPYGYLRPARVIGVETGFQPCIRDIAALLTCALVLHLAAILLAQRRRCA